MRISHNQLIDHLVANLTQTSRRMLRWHQQAASGRRINAPSDDPSGILTALTYRRSLVELERYGRNAADAAAWLRVSEEAAGSAHEVVVRARELVVVGASENQPPASRSALVQEIDQLIEQLVQLGNTTHDGRYVFGGHQTTGPAFEWVTPPGGSGQPSVAYRGDSGTIRREIARGVELQVNVRGDELFMPAFIALFDVRQALADGDTAALSGPLLEALDAAGEQLLQHQVRLGAAMRRAEQADQRARDTTILFQRLLSGVEDADIAEVALRLAAEETSYRQALAAGARIIQPTLIDYLR